MTSEVTAWFASVQSHLNKIGDRTRAARATCRQTLGVDPNVICPPSGITRLDYRNCFLPPAIEIMKGIQCLIQSRPAPTQPPPPVPEEPQLDPDSASPTDTRTKVAGPDQYPLDELINRFKSSTTPTALHMRYSNDLEQSWAAFRNHKQFMRNEPAPTAGIACMESYVGKCLVYMKNIFGMIVMALKPRSTVEALLVLTGLQSPISPRDILIQLRKVNFDQLRKAPE